MLRNSETVLFFIATVAALALPAVPALQELRAGEAPATQATAPMVIMPRIVITPSSHCSPEQVAMVH
jgi:hypothetical protein